MIMHFGATMTNKPIRSMLVLALSLSMSVAPVAAVAQAPQAEAAAKPSRLWIETDTQALGERGVGMQAAVTRELRSAFEAEGVKLVDEQQPNAVHLRLRFSGMAEDVRVFNYVLHFELVQGNTSTELIEPVSCPRCFDETLYNTIAAKVPTLLEAIEAEPKINAVAADGNPDGNPAENGHEDPSVEPLPKPIGPVGISGAVVLAAGIGLSIGGGVVLANPKQREIQGHQILGIERNRTPLGISLVVPGVTLVVVGTAMLAVDLSRRAKQRKGAQSITVIPTLSPSSAGIGVVGRF